MSLIAYNGYGIEIRRSLLNVVLHEQLNLNAERDQAAFICNLCGPQQSTGHRPVM